MKLESAGMTLTAVGSSIMSAAGATAQLGESAASFAMMGVGGLCAIVGALYYRASQNETALLDIAISIVMAFLVGAAVGGVAGAWLEGYVFRATGFHFSQVAQHMIGGAVVGGVLAPLTRALVSGKIGAILTAAKQFLESVTGGRK